MFTTKSSYNLKSLTVMARALRKTLRRGRSIATRIFTVAVISALLFIVVGLFLIGEVRENIGRLAVDVGMIAFLVLTMLLDDVLNGWVAERQTLPNARDAEVVFNSDDYTVTTSVTQSTLTYKQIVSICETKEYIIFFLSKRHGQVFEKSGFQNCDLQDFRAFIMDKTGKAIQYIK